MITIDPPSRLSIETATSLRTSLTRFLRRAQEAVGLQGTVDLLLTDDQTMRRLNRQFRGKHRSTDVLSFPAPAVPGLPEGATHAGDLAISLAIAEEQASEQGHTLGVELRVLVLHGLLHLHGMDHETDQGEMGEREAELRRHLRLPQSLIRRTQDNRKSRTGERARRGAPKVSRDASSTPRRGRVVR